MIMLNPRIDIQIIEKTSPKNERFEKLIIIIIGNGMKGVKSLNKMSVIADKTVKKINPNIGTPVA